MVYVNGVQVKNKILDMSSRSLVRVAILGLIVGLIVYVLGFLLQKFVITPIFCGGFSQTLVCGTSTRIAGDVAAIIAAIFGLFGIIKLGINRHGLVPIASLALLLGAYVWTSSYHWLAGVIWTAVLYGLTYMFMGWISRIRNIWVMAGIMVLAVILVRLMIFFMSIS